MKTILHLHILIRLVASCCIIYSLFQLIIAWPQAARLRDVIQKQKETTAMLGRDFELSAFLPTFAEILLAPILLLGIGVFAFVATKKTVELIVGREPIRELLKLDQSQLKTHNHQL